MKKDKIERQIMDKEFIQRLVEELNKIKDEINPTLQIPFFFNEFIQDYRGIGFSDKYQKEVILKLTFGTKGIVILKYIYKKINEKDIEPQYKEFINQVLKYILFFKDFNGKNGNGEDLILSSIQTIIKTIKVYEE